MGADLILIDDPVKSRFEANSKAYRDRCWEWFTDDLYTRQEPGCAIVLTMTRWHEEDLAGLILASEVGPEWSVVNLPALAEKADPLGRAEGEAIWPDRYPVAELERRKKLMGASNFAALFQGSPRPADGTKFRRGSFRYWRHPEGAPDLIELGLFEGRTKLVRLRDCLVFATVDTAVTARTSADYTVFSVWAKTPDSDLILLAVYRDQVEEPGVIDLAYTVFTRWNPSYFAVEENGIGKPIIQNLRRGVVDGDGKKRPGLPVRAIVAETDKISRASTAVVRVESGQVYFPAKAEWLDAWESELLTFPNGHDDQVDTLSLAANNVFYLGGSDIDTAEAIAEREKTEKAERDKAQAEWMRPTTPLSGDGEPCPRKSPAGPAGARASPAAPATAPSPPAAARSRSTPSTCGPRRAPGAWCRATSRWSTPWPGSTPTASPGRRYGSTGSTADLDRGGASGDSRTARRKAWHAASRSAAWPGATKSTRSSTTRCWTSWTSPTRSSIATR